MANQLSLCVRNIAIYGDKLFLATATSLQAMIRRLHGYPISYSVKGRQYVAVPTGIGVFRALTATVSPGIYQPSNGQALFVFALSEP